MLSDVFLPLLLQQVGVHSTTSGLLESGGRRSTGGGGSHMSRELLNNMQKYMGQVSQTMQHLTGDIELEVPAIAVSSVSAAAADMDLVHTLEEVVARWSAKLSEAMQRESEKKPVGKGPLAEIEFWRSRSAVSIMGCACLLL